MLTLQLVFGNHLIDHLLYRNELLVEDEVHGQLSTAGIQFLLTFLCACQVLGGITIYHGLVLGIRLSLFGIYRCELSVVGMEEIYLVLGHHNGNAVIIDRRDKLHISGIDLLSLVSHGHRLTFGIQQQGD